MEYTYYEDDITCDNSYASNESLQLSDSLSSANSCFLPPYPGSHESKTGKPIYSERRVKLAESKQQQNRSASGAISESIKSTKQQKKSSGTHKDHYYKEYTIKISGLSFDVRESDIVKLAKPFGDLTSPVRIASYPENNIYYAYVNYYSARSAILAVSELDEIEFNGAKMHVCHRSELGVEHSCRERLKELAKKEYGIVSRSVENFHVHDTSVLDVLQVGSQKSRNVTASSVSISKMSLKPECLLEPVSDSPQVSDPDINDVENSPHIHHCPLDDPKAFSEALTNVKQPQDSSSINISPHIEKKATEKLRNVPRCIFITKKSPKPGKGLHQIEPSKVLSQQSNLYIDTMSISPIKSKHARQLDDSNINNLSSTSPPAKGATEDSKDVTTYASVIKNSSKPTKVLPETSSSILLQEPDVSTENVEHHYHGEHQAVYDHQTISDNNYNVKQLQASSSIHNLPWTVSPQNQVPETFENTTSCVSVAQSSLQAVKMVQDTKPDSILQQQQQTTINTNAMDSNGSILKVTSLHPDVCVQDLERYFKPYGALKSPISIRIHPGSDSCFAIVHYVSADAAQKAMEKLNGCDVSGYQMHIVGAWSKETDVKAAVDKISTISDPVLIDDPSIVELNNLHIPVKKTMESISCTENSTVLSTK